MKYDIVGVNEYEHVCKLHNPRYALNRWAVISPNAGLALKIILQHYLRNTNSKSQQTTGKIQIKKKNEDILIYLFIC